MVRYLLVWEANHIYGRVLRHSEPIKAFDSLKAARAYAVTHSENGRTIFIIKQKGSSETVVGYVDTFPLITKDRYLVSQAYFNDLGTNTWPINKDGSLGRRL